MGASADAGPRNSIPLAATKMRMEQAVIGKVPSEASSETTPDDPADPLGAGHKHEIEAGPPMRLDVQRVLNGRLAIPGIWRSDPL